MRFTQKVLLVMLSTALQNASGETIVLGHRGSRSLFPENTQEGFFKVLDAGIRNLEMDIGMSSDGTLFIYHDTSINPLICASSTVPVSYYSRPYLLHLTDEQIESFDCGSKTQWWRFPRQKKIPGARIPRFENFLRDLKQQYSSILPEIALLVEIKVKDPKTGETASPDDFAPKISDIIERSGLKGQITVQSFSVEFLKKLKQHNPSIETALLWENRWIPSVNQLRELGIKVFLPKFSILNDVTIDTLRQAKFPIIPWTLNSEKDWKRALQWKLDGIITDDPIGLKKFMSHL